MLNVVSVVWLLLLAVNCLTDDMGELVMQTRFQLNEVVDLVVLLSLPLTSVCDIRQGSSTCVWLTNSRGRRLSSSVSHDPSRSHETITSFVSL